MRRFLALALVMLSALTVFVLGGCEEEAENIYKDFDAFDSYVSKDAEILGKWQELGIESEQGYIFYDTTSMHFYYVIDGSTVTTTCTFNFDEESAMLSYYTLANKQEFTYNVEFDGDVMVWKSPDGSDTRTFERVED